MRILFLSAWFPYPPNNGARLRIYHLLRGLAQHHEVTLISLADTQGTAHPPDPEPLKKFCRAVYVVPSKEYRPNSARALWGFFNVRPRVLVDRYSPAMAERIQAELDGGGYDLVVASQWYTAAYLEKLSGPPAIFEEAEIGVFADHVARAASPLRRLRHELTNFKMQLYYRSLLQRFAACTVASETERSLLQEMVPSYRPIHVIPNCVSVASYAEIPATPEPETFIFTGSFRYFANYEAMQWFLEEVYPLIKNELPGARLTITGDHAGLPLPSGRNVVLTGYVNDVRPLVASSWASIVPIRVGGGTRLKILEAMAMRTPVIATSKGAEGLDVRDGEHLLLADTPQDFAQAAVRLARDPGLRRQLVDNAYGLIRARYDWPVVLPQFLSLVEEAAAGGAALGPRLPAPLGASAAGREAIPSQNFSREGEILGGKPTQNEFWNGPKD